MSDAETPYHREAGYAERYRDRRFASGTGARTHRRESRTIRTLVEFAAASAGSGPWLDVPCGVGRLSGLLPGRTVLVDRDLAMLRAAPVDAPRVCASVHRLPFADGAFGGALCMRLMQHIAGSDERRRILRELRRVTDGPLLVSFFHAASLQNLRRNLARRFGKRHSGRSAVRFGAFRDDLDAAGFTVRAARPLARFLSEQWIVLATPKP